MLLFQMKSELREVQLARIEAMYEGKGRAKGKKMSVVLSHTVHGKTVSERVDFWNSHDTRKPQLADRIRKQQVGDYIVVLVSKKDEDYTALDFKASSGTFVFHENEESEVNVIIGYVGNTEEKEVLVRRDNRMHKVFQVGVPMRSGDETRWQNISFWDASRNPALYGYAVKTADKAKADKCLAVMVCGKKSGSDYTGFGIYLIPSNAAQHEKAPETPACGEAINNRYDVQISLGPYKSNPVLLSRILDVESKDKKENLTMWLQYVAGEWQPTTPDEESQKSIIKSFVAEKCI